MQHEGRAQAQARTRSRSRSPSPATKLKRAESACAAELEDIILLVKEYEGKIELLEAYRTESKEQIEELTSKCYHYEDMLNDFGGYIDLTRGCDACEWVHFAKYVRNCSCKRLQLCERCEWTDFEDQRHSRRKCSSIDDNDDGCASQPHVPVD